MELTLRAPGSAPPPSARPPLVALTPQDVAALHDDLLAYHREFAPLFRRAEQRHWALRYLEGQLLPIERKSPPHAGTRPMADALVGGNVQSMQQFIGLGAWDDEAVLARHQHPARRDAGRRGERGAHRRRLRLPQAGRPLRGGGAPVVRRPGQGRQLPGQRGRLLR